MTTGIGHSFNNKDQHRARRIDFVAGRKVFLLGAELAKESIEILHKRQTKLRICCGIAKI